MSFGRKYQIGFLVSENEKKQIERNAKEKGLGISSYLRLIALQQNKNMEE